MNFQCIYLNYYGFTIYLATSVKTSADQVETFVLLSYNVCTQLIVLMPPWVTIPNHITHTSTVFPYYVIVWIRLENRILHTVQNITSPLLKPSPDKDDGKLQMCLLLYGSSLTVNDVTRYCVGWCADAMGMLLDIYTDDRLLLMLLAVLLPSRQIR